MPLGLSGFGSKGGKHVLRARKGAERGDLFMSLVYSCELNGLNPLDLSEGVATARRLVETAPIGLDAVELPGDAGAAGDVGCRTIDPGRNSQ